MIRVKEMFIILVTMNPTDASGRMKRKGNDFLHKYYEEINEDILEK